jgi:hypothetical protein
MVTGFAHIYGMQVTHSSVVTTSSAPLGDAPKVASSESCCNAALCSYFYTYRRALVLLLVCAIGATALCAMSCMHANSLQSIELVEL